MRNILAKKETVDYSTNKISMFLTDPDMPMFSHADHVRAFKFLTKNALVYFLYPLYQSANLPRPSLIPIVGLNP